MAPEKTDERQSVVDKLIDLLRVEASRLELQKALQEHHPADIAEALDDVSPEIKRTILDTLDLEQRVEVLDETGENDVEEYVEEHDVEQIAELVDAMPSDEAADMLELVEEDKVELVIAKLDPERAIEIRELREYPPDAAGGLMTTEYFSARPDESAGEVIARIREEYEEVETVHRIFVLNETGKLKGKISVEDLISAPPEQPVHELTDTAVITIGPLADQEVAARYMQKYDLTVLPVVDPGRRLLGIITVDDILEVLSEEASEDMYRMAGVGAPRPLEQPAWVRAYKRLPWLITTIVGMGIIAPFLLDHLFADTLKSVVVLALFIPAIMGLGGNAAMQSATITVRGLATGEIDFGDWGWLLKREIAVGLIIACSCSAVVGGCAYGLVKLGLEKDTPSIHITEVPGAADAQHTSPVKFGLTVAAALFTGIVLSVVLGTSVPLLCHRAGVDPAVAAGPFITTLIDIGTQTLYLGIATFVLLG